MLDTSWLNWSRTKYLNQAIVAVAVQKLTHTSSLNQSGGGGTDFYNKFTKAEDKYNKPPSDSGLPFQQIKYCLQFVIAVKIISFCNMSFTFLIRTLHGGSICGSRRTGAHCVSAITKKWWLWNSMYYLVWTWSFCTSCTLQLICKYY